MLLQQLVESSAHDSQRLLSFCSGRAIVVEGAGCPWGGRDSQGCHGTLSWCHERSRDSRTGSYSRIVSLQDPSDCLLYSLGISMSFPWKQLVMLLIQKVLDRAQVSSKKNKLIICAISCIDLSNLCSSNQNIKRILWRIKRSCTFSFHKKFQVCGREFIDQHPESLLQLSRSIKHLRRISIRILDAGRSLIVSRRMILRLRIKNY